MKRLTFFRQSSSVKKAGNNAAPRHSRESRQNEYTWNGDNDMTDAAIPPRRKRTARFIEIAEAAGVSSATVDRVLNERGSVSAATRARVVAAARQLAVPRVLPDTHHGLMHMEVLLPQNSTSICISP